MIRALLILFTAYILFWINIMPNLLLNKNYNDLDKSFQCHIKHLENLQNKYFDKYDLRAPKKKFSWQKSFHYNIIKNKESFLNHIQYLQNQWIKHKQKENKYCYIDEDAIKEFFFSQAKIRIFAAPR